jgi:hypothetical protein
MSLKEIQIASGLTPTSTLLDLLSASGHMQLPNGIVLRGDAETGYITIGYWGVDGHFVSEGLWSLSESGLVDALDDADKIALELAGGDDEEEEEEEEKDDEGWLRD